MRAIHSQIAFTCDGHIPFHTRRKAKCTVMGGQQVCNQACMHCNDGGVTVTTQ